MNILNVSFNVCGIVFVSFLMIFYFMKRGMPNIENKIYRFILIFSLLIPTIDLIYWISCYYLKDYQIIIEIEARIFLTFLLSWLVFLSYYIVVTSNKDKKFVMKHLIKDDKISVWPWIIIAVVAIFELFLSFGCVTDKNGVVLYTVGDVYFFNVYLIGAFIFLCLICTLFGRKKITLQKATPIFVFLFYEITIFIVYCFNRTICIFTLSSTLTSYLMFFTIENPDLKLIKELTLAKNQAELASNAKTDFLASMSHEIRTPLNSIVGLSQMIRDGDNMEEMKSDSKDIIKASEDLLEIINGILDINILDANRLELLEEAYDPHDLLLEIEQLSKVKIGDKPITYSTNYFNDIPGKLYGDKEKIKRILTSIISNSIKFTDSGTIIMNVSSTLNSGYCVLRLSISDTGKGIKPEDIPHVFDRFYRSEEYRDSDVQGTGLGLAIAKSLVELFNGRIAVDSVYGSGSTFTVLIPQKIITK